MPYARNGTMLQTQIVLMRLTLQIKHIKILIMVKTTESTGYMCKLTNFLQIK